MFLNHPYPRPKTSNGGLTITSKKQSTSPLISMLFRHLKWDCLLNSFTIGHYRPWHPTFINGWCNWHIIFPSNRFQGWIDWCLLTTKPTFKEILPHFVWGWYPLAHAKFMVQLVYPSHTYALITPMQQFMSSTKN